MMKKKGDKNSSPYRIRAYKPLGRCDCLSVHSNQRIGFLLPISELVHEYFRYTRTVTSVTPVCG